MSSCTTSTTPHTLPDGSCVTQTMYPKGLEEDGAYKISCPWTMWLTTYLCGLSLSIAAYDMLICYSEFIWNGPSPETRSLSELRIQAAALLRGQKKRPYGTRY